MHIFNAAVLCVCLCFSDVSEMNMWLLKSCSASTPPLKPVSRAAVQIQSSILLPKSDDLCPIDILREILYFFLKLQAVA